MSDFPRMVTDQFSLPEGPVTLQWPQGMSAASYAEFAEWLKLIDRKTQRATEKQP